MARNLRASRFVGYTLIMLLFASSVFSFSNIIWLEEGSVIKTISYNKELNVYERHSVELIDVSEDSSRCGFSVDGDIVWLERKEARRVNGIIVSPRDIVVVHAFDKDMDVCKVLVSGAVEGVFSKEEGTENEIIMTEVPDDDTIDDIYEPLPVEGEILAVQEQPDPGQINEQPAAEFPEKKKGLFSGFVGWLKGLLS